jgi:hypothetical protein
MRIFSRMERFCAKEMSGTVADDNSRGTGGSEYTYRRCHRSHHPYPLSRRYSRFCGAGHCFTVYNRLSIVGRLYHSPADNSAYERFRGKMAFQ